MQSDLEVLLKLLVIDYQFRAEYLSVEVLGRGFDLDGLFVPVNAAQVVFSMLVYDEGLSYYWDGIRLIIQEYAAILIASRNFDNSPPSRSFDEVFMQESFPLT